MQFSCVPVSTGNLGSFEEDLPDVVDFNFHIKPLLSDRCFKCHGPDKNQRKADLRLDFEEYAYAESDLPDSEGKYIIKPRSLKNSEVMHRILSTDEDYVMPPFDSNLSLSEREKALIAKWIDQGAVYDDHWSFLKPEPQEPPKVENDSWVSNPIDRFILKQVEDANLQPAKEASSESLLRRISMDLTGLPPSPEEILEFVGNDSPRAYEEKIDQLLASDHFGERMALEWLDVARYADSHGYQDDGMRTTWPWRDWVIKAFNENMPYDQFLMEQIAGDMLPNPTKDQILATCFNRNHPQTQEGGVVDEEYRVEYVADRTNTFGKALLGLTMECARCHDHKYDPISQEDYYSLYAIFNNNNDAGIVPYDGEAAPTVMLPTPEEEELLKELSAKMTPIEDAMSYDNYEDDLRLWLGRNSSPVDLSYGLTADFDFDRELNVARSSLNLDGNSSPGWAGLGRKGTITGYVNNVKGRVDAVIFGDHDRKPEVVEGLQGKALHFLGDCGVRFNRDLDYDRYQPFSVSIWVKLLKSGEKGPIFNNTNGDFEGYRGWICKLNEDGTLSYQLNHVWPDNCIDYRTLDPIEVGQWTHIAMTYDGSSQAEGFKLYVNGVKAESRLLKDNLKRSVLHGKNGSNWSSFPFLIGREKERSIENFLIDELKLYNRTLSKTEVQMLFDPQTNRESTEGDKLETYLLAGHNERFNQHLEQLTSLRVQENELMTNVMEVMVMNELDDKRTTYVLDRGAYDAPTSEVNPSLPSILKDAQDNPVSDRLELANWLVSEENPLTSRIVVNRIWTMFFGKGIVSTHDDFGSQGALPSHPELLDWMALELMNNEWDIKRFIKTILLSSTYRQSSFATEIIKEKDPGNAYYTRFPSYRLGAEAIRDNALAASGLLIKKIGGPSVYPYQPKGIWKSLATRNATVYEEGEGEDLYRRSMYTVWKRSSPPPSMMNFDAPDRYLCIVNRQKTSTPLQSLVLMNDPQFTEASKALAVKSLKQGDQELENRIHHMYLSLIGRKAKEREVELMTDLYEEEKQAFMKDVSRASEILEVGSYYVEEDLDKIEVASHMILASTIMNYDEFVMKR